MENTVKLQLNTTWWNAYLYRR